MVQLTNTIAPAQNQQQSKSLKKESEKQFPAVLNEIIGKAIEYTCLHYQLSLESSGSQLEYLQTYIYHLTINRFS